MLFDFISILVCNYGIRPQDDRRTSTLKILFLTISHETGWIIDRNIEYLTFEVLNKKWSFSKEYEPLPFI